MTDERSGMDADSFLEKLRYYITRRQWKSAVSWCEQGIVSLAQQEEQPPDPFADPHPVADLQINGKSLADLDKHGIVTIGQLRRSLRMGDDKVWYLGTGARLEEIKRALVLYEEVERQRANGRVALERRSG